MLDMYIDDQPIAYKLLINSLNNGKLSHAYLFETNNYCNGFDMALVFAKTILHSDSYVANKEYNNLENNDCLKLKIIDSDGLWIKKEQLDNLQKDFNTKSLDGSKQVYIINHAERLNSQAANSILKFLEEPQPNIVAILVTNNKYNLLDTIISRCQLINLKGNKIDNSKNQIEKIGFCLYNNKSDISNFSDDDHNKKIIDCVVQFIVCYEKHGIDTLLFTNKYWHSVIKEKSDILNAFSIMLLYYKDILNMKFNKTPLIFDTNAEMEFIKNNNTELKICDKINTLLRQKEKIQYNTNNSLLIDKLIIEMRKLDD